MSTSADKQNAKTALIYLSVSVFTAFAGAVYELFSHGVYSLYMIYAFAYPLVGGALPYLILSLTNKPKPSGIAPQLYHSGIATLTVGSIMKGVFEIYGSSNAKSAVYTPVGIALVVAAAVLLIYNEIKVKQAE